MTLPTTVRTAVSPDTRSKVTRLFNGTAGDVLAELFQNARRAGATRVTVATSRTPDGPIWITVADDGRGVADPAALLTLGRSGWNANTLRAEDPAGMGLFALAGRPVRVSSRGDAGAWSVGIPAEAWTSGADLTVERSEEQPERGTAVAFAAPEAWASAIKADVERAARHYPLPVTLNGAEVQRTDFLAGALRIEDWRGLRLGVVRERRWNGEPRINFHGVTVPCPLPQVAEERGETWTVLVEVVDCPELQLVLPARKEVVVTPFLDALREACESAIYRHVAARGSHALPFASWHRAADLGVALPPAVPTLDSWSPVTNDGDVDLTFRPRSDEGTPALPAEAVIMADLGPDLAQSVARAIALSAPDLIGRLVEARPAYAGYAWYDALPRVTEAVGILVRNRVIWTTADEAEVPESGEVESSTMVLTIASSEGSATRQLDTDLLLVATDEGWSDPDEEGVFVRPGPRLTPGTLANAIVAAFFSASDDRDADSYDTQLERYERAALDLARRLLLGDDEADLARLRDAVAEHLAWLVPKGRELRVRYDAGIIEVSLTPLGEGSAGEHAA